jgi:hypothetical protein
MVTHDPVWGNNKIRKTKVLHTNEDLDDLDIDFK